MASAPPFALIAGTGARGIASALSAKQNEPFVEPEQEA
jgi:hypothetical protein